jgi:3-hydroxybutyryl-CoA dehydrogenase
MGDHIEGNIMLINEKTGIGILGAGLMGHGLAQVFAVKGCDVTIYDRDDKTLSASLDRIRNNLDVFVQLRIVKDDEIEPALNRIRLSSSLAEMCRDREFIIEAVSEKLSVKRQVFS